MKYQIKSKEAPFVQDTLRHGIIIKDIRYKEIRVRMSFAQDKRNLKGSNPNDQNLEYYSRLVTFVGAGVETTFEMITCVSESDMEQIAKMSSEADKLDIEDPKLDSTSIA